MPKVTQLVARMEMPTQVARAPRARRAGPRRSAWAKVPRAGNRKTLGRKSCQSQKEKRHGNSRATPNSTRRPENSLLLSLPGLLFLSCTLAFAKSHPLPFKQERLVGRAEMPQGGGKAEATERDFESSNYRSLGTGNKGPNQGGCGPAWAQGKGGGVWGREGERAQLLMCLPPLLMGY